MYELTDIIEIGNESTGVTEHAYVVFHDGEHIDIYCSCTRNPYESVSNNVRL